jgi:hypothetical protein
MQSTRIEWLRDARRKVSTAMRKKILGVAVAAPRQVPEGGSGGQFCPEGRKTPKGRNGTVGMSTSDDFAVWSRAYRASVLKHDRRWRFLQPSS